MTYFEYNENRHMRKPGTQSRAQLDVIEPPDYWITEHGELTDEQWRALISQDRVDPRD